MMMVMVIIIIMTTNNKNSNNNTNMTNSYNKRRVIKQKGKYENMTKMKTRKQKRKMKHNK